MSQPINITTLSGVRLDVNPSATIELNMGGMSLLSLEDRVASYTNSFTLPRTPTNEREFAFISQPTRNNKAIMDVYITKGLLQKRAKLTVTEFDKTYKCSISYDYNGLYEILKNTPLTFHDFEDIAYNFDTIGEAIDEICSGDLGLLPVQCMLTNTTIINSSFEKTYNVGFYLPRLFELLAQYLNVTVEGTLFDDPFFQKTILLNPLYGITVNDGAVKLVTVSKIGESKVMMSAAIKAICQVFMSDAQIINGKIMLNKIDVNGTAINLEGFEFNKKVYSGYALTNNILYSCDGDDKFFGSDTFLADGVGDKNVITIAANIPKTDSIGYITNVEAIIQKLNLFYSDATDYSHVKYYNSAGVEGYEYAYMDVASILSMSGIYSGTLNSILQNPIILDATKWLDPFTANQVMESRIINSVQLGGRYWVDSMAYNITTGQSKMTLIKL